MQSIQVGNDLFRKGRFDEAEGAYRQLIGGPLVIAEMARVNLELIRRIKRAGSDAASVGATDTALTKQLQGRGSASGAAAISGGGVSLAQLYSEISSKTTKDMLESFDGKYPMVSVIVTAHNTERYLDSCVESLIGQSYPNKEIVIVDDFSSDDTPHIARRLERTYREVKYRRLNCNLGTYYAKNLGVSISAGEYLFFQDSDDISHPLRIAILVNQLRASGKRIIRGSYSRVDPDSDRVLEVNGLVSKLGLITLGVERGVFNEIGYFNCTTKASDDEFYHRIVRFLGKGEIINNDLPLYYNTYREGSLFADMVTRKPDGSIEQRPSESRARYVDSFRKVHDTHDLKTIESVFRFPRIRDAVDVLSDMTKLPNPDERVIYSVCSIPKREAVFERVVKSIIDQCDELHVYLDSYNHVPAFLTRLGSKCRIVMSTDKPGLRDNGKFLLLEELVRRGEKAYYFTIDDDIVYPADYTNAMVSRLKRYRNRCVVGVHGVLLKDRPSGYFSDRRVVYSFTKGLETERAVSLLGTGTLAFHTTIFNHFGLDEFANSGMADIYFALKCKRDDVPMLAISRFEGWLVDVNPEPQASLYHEFKDADQRQAELVRRGAPWGLEQITSTIEAVGSIDPATAESLRATMLPLKSLTR